MVSTSVARRAARRRLWAFAPVLFLFACLNPDISDEVPLSETFIAADVSDAGLEEFADEPADEALPVDEPDAVRRPRDGVVRIRWRR